MVLAGCSPSLPAGSYLCAADHACPSGQHCACGLCVNHDDEAACMLTLDTGSADELTIHEHEPFPLTVKASTQAGTAATAFGGTVALSFRLPDGTIWGDVRPASVQLKGGQAQVMVTVNRETIPPQEPRLEAHFADAAGQSAPLHVLPQPLTRDPTPVAQAPFGWADVGVGFPSVTWDGKQFRMYFAGLGGKMQQGFGVATSTDNKRFTPNGVPLFPGSDAGFTSFVLSAFPFQVGGQWRTAVYGVDDKKIAGGAFWVAESADGLSPFTVTSGGAPVLQTSSCAYCDTAVWFPSVLAQKDSSDWLMFFGALHCNKPAGMTCSGLNDNVSAQLGRAHSTDGLSFQPEPAPILSGDMGGETYLAAPQVIKDGSIYKMWYAFTRQLAFGDACLAQINVGYATSTDGFYWVRSPSNPVLALDGTGWEGGATAMLPGSVVPADGQDLESGLVLYYSPLETVLVYPFCIPSGIGRASN
jgi:hypothetical protein